MKTPEDEAFDDLAKRQGAWGGGFPAKKAMAADKLVVTDIDGHVVRDVRKRKLKKAAAQEPVARVSGTYGGRFVYEPLNPSVVLPIGMALYAGPQRPWAGLTDAEREEIALEVPMDAVFITEAKLKEKNG